MVAIKNDINKNINFVNSTLHSEKTNELFAELFALMNCESLNSENKYLLKEAISHKNESEENFDAIKNASDNKLLKITPEKSELEITKSEYETAKSLIEVFYKEIGIVELDNQTKKTVTNDLKHDQKLLLNKNLTTDESKLINKKILNSNEFNLEQKNDNSGKIVLNIFKQPLLNKKLKKNEHNQIIFKEKENKFDSKLLNKQNDFNNKVNNSNFETAVINKKIIKKSKQFKVSTKEKLENNEFHAKNFKIEHRKSTNISQIKQKSGENQLTQKREISNKDFSKTMEIKDKQISSKGQTFLDLLESSWGEKFSRIIKNAVNNGVNKLEIQVKPKNLGKLNLEVSVKNSVTSINIGSENQDVVSLLNDNLPKLLESIDKETRGFSSNMNNESKNSNNFNEKKDREKFESNNEISRKNKKNVENKNQILSNHYIDVNA